MEQRRCVCFFEHIFYYKQINLLSIDFVSDLFIKNVSGSNIFYKQILYIYQNMDINIVCNTEFNKRYTFNKMTTFFIRIIGLICHNSRGGRHQIIHTFECSLLLLFFEIYLIFILNYYKKESKCKIGCDPNTYLLVVSICSYVRY